MTRPPSTIIWINTKTTIVYDTIILNGNLHKHFTTIVYDTTILNDNLDKHFTTIVYDTIILNSNLDIHLNYKSI